MSAARNPHGELNYSEMTSVSDLCIEYARATANLGALVEWMINHDGECLGDNPHQLEIAKQWLAEAKALRDRSAS